MQPRINTSQRSSVRYFKKPDRPTIPGKSQKMAWRPQHELVAATAKLRGLVRDDWLPHSQVITQ